MKGILIGILLSFNIYLSTCWSLLYQWTPSQSSSPVSHFAFYLDVFVSSGTKDGNSVVQFWRISNRGLLAQVIMESQVVALISHPSLHHVYVALKSGKIQTYSSTSYSLIGDINYTAGTPSDMKWKGSNQIIIAGNDSTTQSPSYSIYTTNLDGTLAFSRQTTTIFQAGSTINRIAVANDFSRVALFSDEPGEQVVQDTPSTQNETNSTNVTTKKSFILQYSLANDQFIGDVPNQVFDQGTSIAYLGTTLYTLEPNTTIAQRLGKVDTGFSRVPNNQLDIKSIKQSKFNNQLIAEISNSDNTYSILILENQNDGSFSSVSESSITDSSGRTISAYQFSEGMEYLGVGFSQNGQQLYGSSIPIAAFVVPIAVILGVSAIVGIVVVAKGSGAAAGAAAGAGQGGNPNTDNNLMDEAI